MARVCFISDCLAEPYDEGARVLARGFAQGLAAQGETLAIGVAERGRPGVGAEWIPARRPLLSTRLRDRVRRFRPDLVLYLPWSSASLAGFASAWVLKRSFPGAPVGLIAFQPREYGPAARLVLPRLAPDCVLCFSSESQARLEALGVRAARARVGVDGSRFKPVGPAERARLRRRYGFDPAARIALHVGHLKRERNLDVLKAIAQLPGWTAALVASTATRPERDYARELLAAGVRIVREPLDHVEHFYQLADCYVFPVSEPTACAEAPLSVFEALACGAAAAATRFGAREDDTPPGVTLVDDAGDLAAAVAAGLPPPPRPYAVSWAEAAHAAVRACLAARLARPRFIVITGMDGGGKTTQAKRLLAGLKGRGERVQYLWLRGRPLVTLPLLMLGRKLLGAPSLLRTPSVARRETPRLAAAEAEYQEAKTRWLRRGLLGRLWLTLNLLERLVEAWARVLPARGRTLVADRYVFDSIVDLAAARRAADWREVWRPDGRFARLLPKPDAVFFIDVDVETAMRRKADIPSRQYLERRRGLYLDMARALGWTRVDGTQDADAVARFIWERVDG